MIFGIFGVFLPYVAGLFCKGPSFSEVILCAKANSPSLLKNSVSSLRKRHSRHSSPRVSQFSREHGNTEEDNQGMKRHINDEQPPCQPIPP